MSRKAIISNKKLSEHLTLSLCHPDSECRTENWWLYDSRAGMNLGMREESSEVALVEATNYWAGRALRAEKAYNYWAGLALRAEKAYKDLNDTVVSFISKLNKD